MALTVDRIEKIPVHINHQILNVAVLRFKESISVKEFVVTHDAFFVYHDEEGISRIALPERPHAFEGYLLVPGGLSGLFGFQPSSKIVTGCHAKDVRAVIDRFTFVGVLDCQEVMRKLFVSPNKPGIKTWCRDPVNVAATYLLTIKGATVEVVELFLKENSDLNLQTLSTLFDLFELPMPDISDPAIDDALQLLETPFKKLKA